MNKKLKIGLILSGALVLISLGLFYIPSPAVAATVCVDRQNTEGIGRTQCLIGETIESSWCTKNACGTAAGTPSFMAPNGIVCSNSSYITGCLPSPQIVAHANCCYDSSAKSITALSFVALSATAHSIIINEIDHTIKVLVLNGTDIASLVPTISVSYKALVSPASGIAQNFTSPVTYTLTAADDSTQNYVVTVNFDKIITSTTTISCGSNFVDSRDSKTYPTVKIGNQCWMAKNLDYDNGCSSQVFGGGASCGYYTGGPFTDEGRLYQWSAAMDGSISAGAKGICPSGWHVPTDTEWYELENYLTDPGQTCSTPRIGYDCATAANKLKEAGGSHWYSPGLVCSWGYCHNVVNPGNNSSGFTALGAGYGTTGGYHERMYYAFFWSSSSSAGNAAPTIAILRSLQNAYNDAPKIRSTVANKAEAYSVRCVANPPAITAFSFNSIFPLAAGVITESNHTIAVSVPYGTNITSLAPTIAVSTNASVSPASGVAQNFNDPVTYTVTTPGGIAQNYIVTVWACGKNLVDSRDSKSYATVQIGAQCWMKQSMNVGTRINIVARSTGDQGTSCSAIKKFCYLDADSYCTSNNPNYPDGGLYEWNQAMCGAASCNGTGEGQPGCATPVQGICPSGWHIPSHYEYVALGRAVCSSETCATDFPYDITTERNRGTTEGTKLKSGGSSGFEGNLAGQGRGCSGGMQTQDRVRPPAPNYCNRGIGGSFLTSTSYYQPTWGSWQRYLSSSNSYIYTSYADYSSPMSVRCVRDTATVISSSLDVTARYGTFTSGLTGNTVSWTAQAGDIEYQLVKYDSCVSKTPAQIVADITADPTMVIDVGLSTTFKDSFTTTGTQYRYAVRAKSSFSYSSFALSNCTEPAQARQQLFTISGAGFQNGMDIQLKNDTDDIINCNTILPVSNNELRANCDIADLTPVGKWSIQVCNGTCGINPVIFTASSAVFLQINPKSGSAAPSAISFSPATLSVQNGVINIASISGKDIGALATVKLVGNVNGTDREIQCATPLSEITNFNDSTGLVTFSGAGLGCSTNNLSFPIPSSSVWKAVVVNSAKTNGLSSAPSSNSASLSCSPIINCSGKVCGDNQCGGLCKDIDGETGTVVKDRDGKIIKITKSCDAGYWGTLTSTICAKVGTKTCNLSDRIYSTCIAPYNTDPRIAYCVGKECGLDNCGTYCGGGTSSDNSCLINKGSQYTCIGTSCVCTNPTWTPDPANKCETVTQTSNCSPVTTQTVPGGLISCTAPDTCGGGGTPNTCGCTPVSQASVCDNVCGFVSDGCGGTYTCNDDDGCSGIKACNGSGKCTIFGW